MATSGEDNMAVAGKNRWPSLGRNRWPLAPHRKRSRDAEFKRVSGRLSGSRDASKLVGCRHVLRRCSRWCLRRR